MRGIRPFMLNSPFLSGGERLLLQPKRAHHFSRDCNATGVPAEPVLMSDQRWVVLPERATERVLVGLQGCSCKVRA